MYQNFILALSVIQNKIKNKVLVSLPPCIPPPPEDLLLGLPPVWPSSDSPASAPPSWSPSSPPGPCRRMSPPGAPPWLYQGLCFSINVKRMEMIPCC